MSIAHVGLSMLMGLLPMAIVVSILVFIAGYALRLGFRTAAFRNAAVEAQCKRRKGSPGARWTWRPPSGGRDGPDRGAARPHRRGPGGGAATRVS
jgi:hypothetical protein